MKKYEEGFFMCVAYRQLLTMRQRADYRKEREDAQKVAVIENYQPFVGVGSSVTVKEVMAQYDWEEPFPLNSPWSQRRRQLLDSVGEHLRTIGGDPLEAGFRHFWFAVVLFHTGSDKLVGAMEQDMTKLCFDDASAAGSVISKYLHEVSYEIFHGRFMPMRKKANAIRRAAANAEFSPWTRAKDAAADELDEESAVDEADDEGGEVKPSTQHAGKLNACVLAVKYLEELPSVRQLRGAWSALQDRADPGHAWDACAALPGFRGDGFSLKNFGLLYFRISELDARSTGGVGAKRCYNVAMGAARLQKMSDETLALLVNRDMMAADHFWNGNFLGRAVFEQLRDHERKLGAVVLTSNRCAMDKITWKVAHKVRPPAGHDTWRAWSRVQRASAT